MGHLVPPLVSFLGHNKDWKKEAFHRLHTICCGAAPLGAAAATKLMDRLNIDGCILQEGFGMTESSPVSHMGPISNYKIGSCGELVSRTLAKIVDINTGEALGPNQEGELCVFGPQVMKGYYNNEKATQEIRNFIAPQVAAHKQLKGGVVFIDSIPTSATGKLLRRELKAQLSQYS